MGNGALKFFLYLKQEGNNAFIRKALETLISPVLKYKKVFIYMKVDNRAAGVKANTVAIFKEASSEDSLILEKVMYQGRDSIHEKFLKGDRCFIAEAGGEIAHYTWVSLSEEYLPSIERTMKLGKNEAYIYNVRTLPKFRNQGMFSFVLNNSCEKLNKAGYVKIWVSILSDNILSQKGFEKAGFKKFQEIGYLRIFGFRKYRFKDFK